MKGKCPECGADHCWEKFEELLALDFTPGSEEGKVHNLAVASYALQHLRSESPKVIAWAVFTIESALIRQESLYTIREKAKLLFNRNTDPSSYEAPPLPDHPIDYRIHIGNLYQFGNHHEERVRNWARCALDVYNALRKQRQGG